MSAEYAEHDTPAGEKHVTAITETTRTLTEGEPGDHVTLILDGEGYEATIDITGIQPFAHEISAHDAEGVPDGRVYGWLMLDPETVETIWEYTRGEMETALDSGEAKREDYEMDTAYQPVPESAAVREDPRTVLLQTPRDPRVPRYPGQWPQLTVFAPTDDQFLQVADRARPVRLQCDSSPEPESPRVDTQRSIIL